MFEFDTLIAQLCKSDIRSYRNLPCLSKVIEKDFNLVQAILKSYWARKVLVGIYWILLNIWLQLASTS